MNQIGDRSSMQLVLGLWHGRLVNTPAMLLACCTAVLRLNFGRDFWWGILVASSRSPRLAMTPTHSNRQHHVITVARLDATEALHRLVRSSSPCFGVYCIAPADDGSSGSLKHACPKGIYVAPVPEEPLLWTGVLFVRKGEKATDLGAVCATECSCASHRTIRQRHLAIPD